MLRKNFSRTKEARKEASIKRQEERDGRSAQEQLARLDQALGVGQGAARERARLLKAISK